MASPALVRAVSLISRAFRSQHRLSPQDQQFIVHSIAAAYREIPGTVEELKALEQGTYSPTLKQYCQEVSVDLRGIFELRDARSLYEYVCRTAAAESH